MTDAARSRDADTEQVIVLKKRRVFANKRKRRRLMTIGEHLGQAVEEDSSR